MHTQFNFHTKPFEHQLQFLQEHAEATAWGVLWEQGTGKTKVVIDNFVFLLGQGKVGALFVVAPNGVHINWVSDELPKHVKAASRQLHTFYYESSKAKSKKHKQDVFDLFNTSKIPVLCMSYDGIMTQAGRDLAKKFLIAKKCFFVADESHHIKNVKAKRTKRLHAASKYAEYKRILTGTPIAQGALDIYSQIRFLDSEFWEKHGFPNYTVFKSYFGMWFTREQCKSLHGYDPKYDKLIGYQNLDELSEILAKISSRVTKDEVLDLPPKLFSKRYVQMSPQQKAVYQSLKEEFLYEYSTGEIVEAKLAVVRVLRLRQVACGYLPFGDEEEPVLIEGKNTRLLSLIELLESIAHQVLIWCCFTKDIDLITEALGERAKRYDGTLSSQENWANQASFKLGETQILVANLAKGSEGLTWTGAKTVIYYSNGTKLTQRLQSEDRVHRIGLKHPVQYIDFITLGSPDERIITNLRDKKEISAQILNDEFTDWI